MELTMRHTLAKSIVFLFVLCLGLIGVAVIAHAQATDLHDAAGQLTKKLHDDPDVQKISGEHIVIAPFENINGKGDAVPRILQEMLTTAFIKAKHFKVLERDQLQSALDELHFQLSDLADPAKAKQIGKLAGATYVLLGSISDTGSATSINARIVSIGSGESVAAEDVDIKTGDAPLAAGGLNPSLGSPTATPSTDATTSPKVTAPAIDLNANAIPTTAGQFTGRKGDFGLLGGTTFKIAWREDLGKDPVFAFSAGDVIGDGTTRLVEYIHPQNSNEAMMRVSKFEGGSFKKTWESEALDTYFTLHLCVAPVTHHSALITLSGDEGCHRTWLWNGTTYSTETYDELITSLNEQEPRRPPSAFAVLQWYSKTQVVRYGGMGGSGLRLEERSEAGDINNASLTKVTAYNFDHGNISITAGDFDNDGKVEIAAVKSDQIKGDDSPIEIYGTDGRKAATTDNYGNILTTWKPVNSKFPYIVACKSIAKENVEPNTTYTLNRNSGDICFIQWNGESYDEVWHSNRIGDEIIDMQVCDPKDEGKPSLVVLSKDQKNYYLTKIVAAG